MTVRTRAHDALLDRGAGCPLASTALASDIHYLSFRPRPQTVAACSGTRGSFTRKVEPLPGVLSTSMEPPRPETMP